MSVSSIVLGRVTSWYHKRSEKMSSNRRFEEICRRMERMERLLASSQQPVTSTVQSQSAPGDDGAIQEMCRRMEGMERLLASSQQPVTSTVQSQSAPGDDGATCTQVREWSIDDVAKWLRAISLDRYSDSFRESEVDGNFLRWLTDDDLRTGLGVEHALHRKKILCGIEELMGMHSPETATGSNHLFPSSPVRLGSPLQSNAQDTRNASR